MNFQDDLAFPADAIEVGRIIGAFGVRGWLRVQPFAADPQALFSSKRWFLKPAQAQGGGVRPGSAPPALLKIREARDHGDGVVARVDGIEDRDGAEALRGVRVFVSRGSFPTPDKDEFYWVDLIGLAVINTQGQMLGEVVGLLETGAQSVLRVVDKINPTPEGEAAERLIPFVNAYVLDVDLPQKRITVDWGLDY